MTQTAVHHRYATVRGQQLFYREAGPADGPVVLLLHGFPTSSSMFRQLIPRLADTYHVIAPDLLGFGLSDAPPVSEFDYTFDALTELTAGLLEQLNIQRYAMYVQDYGAPIGWRLLLREPRSITAIVSQNGNGYVEGFFDSAWTRRAQAYGQSPGPETEKAVRQVFTLDDLRWQYVNGVGDESLVDPDTWHHDHTLLSRPGNDLVQLALFRDYGTNPPLYPALHDCLRSSAVPLLAVWGEGDEIFGPDGARAFATDAVDPEIHLLPGGHFLLESATEEVAGLVRDFLARRWPDTLHPALTRGFHG